MANLGAELKKKGPLGLPMGAWAAIAVIALYLGYKWYTNRGSSGSSSSSTPVDTTGADTTGADTTGYDGGGNTLPVWGSEGGSTDGSGDSSGAINGPIVNPTPPPHKKKKKHKGIHDHKQGVHNTKSRAIHRRKPGKNQLTHPPKSEKRPHSQAKKELTKNVQERREVKSEHNHPGTAPITKIKQKNRPVPVTPTKAGTYPAYKAN